MRGGTRERGTVIINTEANIGFLSAGVVLEEAFGWWDADGEECDTCI